MKLSTYRHIAIATSSLGLLLLTMGCYQLGISVEPNVTASQASPVSAQANNTKSPTKLPNPIATTDTLVAQFTDSNQKLLHQGILRISNKTNIPIRLALLARRSADKNTAKDKTKYNIPAHWDFAPQEGSTKGLILSLPEGKLKLKQGDILVAFAEDGSRRYWGPYVVGETSEPVWNAQQQEWKLVFAITKDNPDQKNFSP